MRSLDNQRPENSSIDWPGIFRTLLVQGLVLLAVSGALIGYLNWSSDADRAEFMDAGKPSIPALKYQAPSSTPVQTVKSQTACYRKA